MSKDRFFAEPVPQHIIAWSCHVVDCQTGRPMEHAQGLSGERARHLADLMNKAERAGPVPEVECRSWSADEQCRTIAYVECDRLRDRSEPGIAGPIKINNTDYQCVEVITTGLQFASSQIRPGEPIGIVVEVSRTP